jgi:hypothetical protein
MPRGGQGRSHQTVKVRAVEFVWVEEAAGLYTRYGVCMGGVSIACGMGLKQRVIDSCRCRRRQRGGTRITANGNGNSRRLMVAVVLDAALVGVTVTVGVMVLVPVLVLLPKGVVVMMGILMVVSQWTFWGRRRRRGSKIAGWQCCTTAVLFFLFTIAGVHAGGGQDNITATINGSGHVQHTALASTCTFAGQGQAKTSGRRSHGTTERAGYYTRCRISIELGGVMGFKLLVGGLQGSNANGNANASANQWINGWSIKSSNLLRMWGCHACQPARCAVVLCRRNSKNNFFEIVSKPGLYRWWEDGRRAHIRLEEAFR